MIYLIGFSLAMVGSVLVGFHTQPLWAVLVTIGFLLLGGMLMGYSLGNEQ